MSARHIHNSQCKQASTTRQNIRNMKTVYISISYIPYNIYTTYRMYRFTHTLCMSRQSKHTQPQTHSRSNNPSWRCRHQHYQHHASLPPCGHNIFMPHTLHYIHQRRMRRHLYIIKYVCILLLLLLLLAYARRDVLLLLCGEPVSALCFW